MEVHGGLFNDFFCTSHALLQAVPLERFNNVVMKHGVGLTCASMAMTSAGDCPADGTNLSGVGEIQLVPDPSTRYKIPW